MGDVDRNSRLVGWSRKFGEEGLESEFDGRVETGFEMSEEIKNEFGGRDAGRGYTDYKVGYSRVASVTNSTVSHLLNMLAVGAL